MNKGPYLRIIQSLEKRGKYYSKSVSCFIEAKSSHRGVNIGSILIMIDLLKALSALLKNGLN